MSMFQKVMPALDSFGQMVGKHATYSAAKISKVTAGKRSTHQVVPNPLHMLDAFGESAAQLAGTTPDHIWQSLMGAGEGVSRNIGPAADDIWKKFDAIVVESRKHFDSGSEKGKQFDWKGLPGETRDWIIENPKLVAGIVAGVAAPVVAVAAVPAALGMVGFTGGGVAAASTAAGIQAGIGNVAAGSLFSTLTSAGMGGSALAGIQAVVGGVTAVGSVAGNAPGLFKAAKSGVGKDRTCRKNKGSKL